MEAIQELLTKQEIDEMALGTIYSASGEELMFLGTQQRAGFLEDVQRLKAKEHTLYKVSAVK